jgi:hypothetical protein
MEVSSLFLSNRSYGVFAYTMQQQQQQQRKYQDKYESNTKGYQLSDYTKWHLLWVWYKWWQV